MEAAAREQHGQPHCNAQTHAVARPCSIGLFIAWGAVLVITAVVFTVRWGMASLSLAAVEPVETTSVPA